MGMKTQSKTTATKALIRQARKGSEKAWATLLAQEEKAINGLINTYHATKGPYLSRESFFMPAHLAFVDATRKFAVTSNKRFRPFYEKHISKALDNHIIEATAALTPNNEDVSLNRLPQWQKEKILHLEQDQSTRDNNEQCVQDLEIACAHAFMEVAQTELPEEESITFREFYNPNTNTPPTLDDIGKMIGKSRSRAQKIKDKSCANLRHSSKQQKAFNIVAKEHDISGQKFQNLLVSQRSPYRDRQLLQKQRYRASGNLLITELMKDIGKDVPENIYWSDFKHIIEHINDPLKAAELILENQPS